MTITEMPYVELDRHHEQATLALEDARQENNEQAYRCAEALEEKVRIEKIRRMKKRKP